MKKFLSASLFLVLFLGISIPAQAEWDATAWGGVRLIPRDLIIRRSQIGTTSTDGLVFENTTSAAAGAQQISSRTRWTGQGWKTDATAGSQQVDYIAQLVPVQGAAAPQARLDFNYAINGGALQATPTMSLLDGNVGIGTTGPNGKLAVQNTNTAVNRAMNVVINHAAAGSKYGMVLDAIGASTSNYGLYISATDATNNYGIYSIAANNYFSGNVGIGQITFGASAAMVLGMASGTAPTTSLANMAHLWVGDVNAEGGKASFMMRSEITANGNGAVVGAFIKTGTGSFAAGYSGMIEVNEADNLARIWAEGAWRTIATW